MKNTLQPELGQLIAALIEEGTPRGILRFSISGIHGVIGAVRQRMQWAWNEGDAGVRARSWEEMDDLEVLRGYSHLLRLEICGGALVKPFADENTEFGAADGGDDA